jgi:hypothetical protein
MSEDMKIYEVNKITEGESIFNEDGSLTVTLHIQDDMREFVEKMVFPERDYRVRRTQPREYFDKSTWLLKIIREMYENRDPKYKPNPISVETTEMVNDLVGERINMNIRMGFIDLRERLSDIENILHCLAGDGEYDEQELNDERR